MSTTETVFREGLLEVEYDFDEKLFHFFVEVDEQHARPYATLSIWEVQRLTSQLLDMVVFVGETAEESE